MLTDCHEYKVVIMKVQPGPTSTSLDGFSKFWRVLDSF